MKTLGVGGIGLCGKAKWIRGKMFLCEDWNCGSYPGLKGSSGKAAKEIDNVGLFGNDVVMIVVGILRLPLICLSSRRNSFGIACLVCSKTFRSTLSFLSPY